MTKVVLNTDETKFGGQGHIKDNQYLRRTISRRQLFTFLNLFLSFPQQFFGTSTQGSTFFHLIWHFCLCRVDGLRNCLEVCLPSRTAQVGTFSYSCHAVKFFLGSHEFRMGCFLLGRGYTHCSVGLIFVKPQCRGMIVNTTFSKISVV